MKAFLFAVFDAETFKVMFAAAAPWWLTLEHFDVVLKVAASLGAAVYIWRKIWRNK